MQGVLTPAITLWVFGSPEGLLSPIFGSVSGDLTTPSKWGWDTIVHPLYALLKKDVAWTWSDEVHEAFNTLKEKLSEFPILRRPNFNKVFILHTDWSALGFGAIIGQLDEEGKEYVIAYVSRSNNKAESNYSSYEGECLAIVWAVIHFKPYLYGTNFTLYTDH